MCTGTHRRLTVDIGFMENVSEDLEVTVYLSDTIRDIAGYYSVHGKIYYDENDPDKFDYYEVHVYKSRRRAVEYVNRIRNRSGGDYVG